MQLLQNERRKSLKKSKAFDLNILVVIRTQTVMCLSGAEDAEKSRTEVFKPSKMGLRLAKLADITKQSQDKKQRRRNERQNGHIKRLYKFSSTR